MVQALTGFGIFLCLLSLYSLGTWFGNALVNSSNQVVWDVKTTQEGFLEVSKFLGDPRTTTHPSSSYNQDINVVFQTKGMSQVFYVKYTEFRSMMVRLRNFKNDREIVRFFF